MNDRSDKQPSEIDYRFERDIDKELVIIPKKQIEPNQESITKTYNEMKLILKSVLLVALIMIVITLILGIIRSSVL